MSAAVDIAFAWSLAAAAAEATAALVFYGLSRAPGWGALRWLALSGAAAATFSSLNTLLLLPAAPPEAVAFNYRTNIALSAVVAYAWLRFTERFTGRPKGRWDRWLGAALLVVAGLGLVPRLYESTPVVEVVKWPGIPYAVAPSTVFGDLAMLVCVAGFGTCLVRLIRAARGGRPGAWPLAIGLAVFLGAGLNEALSYAGVLPTPFVADVALLVLSVIAGAVTGGQLGERAAILAARTDALDDEVRRRERALGQAREALVRSERLAALGHLAAGVGHEINNPLSSVLSNLRFVAERLPDDAPNAADLHAAVRDADEGARRIERIVGDLRTFARPEIGATDGRIDIASAATSALRLVSHQTERHGITVAQHHEPGLAAPGHAAELAQAISNLLTNALQALPGGDAGPDPSPARIEVRSFRDGDRAVIEVEDNGRGIPPDALPRIFEPYYTTKSVDEGIGLGLSICHGLVGGLGGTIDVRSAPGKGSVFRISLPRYDGVAERLSGPARAPASSGADAPDPERISGMALVRRGPARVLVIDDDPLVARSLVRLLADQQVSIAANAGQAWGQLMSAELDLVLCDVVMPGTDGPGLYRRAVAARPSLARRFVFMTGGALDPSTRRFLQGTAVPCLDKPIAPEKLASLVRASVVEEDAPRDTPTGTGNGA